MPRQTKEGAESREFCELLWARWNFLSARTRGNMGQVWGLLGLCCSFPAPAGLGHTLLSLSHVSLYWSFAPRLAGIYPGCMVQSIMRPSQGLLHFSCYFWPLACLGNIAVLLYQVCQSSVREILTLSFALILQCWELNPGPWWMEAGHVSDLPLSYTPSPCYFGHFQTYRKVRVKKLH